MAARWSRPRCAMIDPNVPFRAVRAARGKTARAEPVAALYEQGRVRHVGAFPRLEDQMCAFVPGAGRSFRSGFDRSATGGSPDRVDALVWAITELLVEPLAGEGIYELIGGSPRGRTRLHDTSGERRQHRRTGPGDRARRERQPGAGACPGRKQRAGRSAYLSGRKTRCRWSIPRRRWPVMAAARSQPAAPRRRCSAASCRITVFSCKTIRLRSCGSRMSGSHLPAAPASRSPPMAGSSRLRRATSRPVRSAFTARRPGRVFAARRW